MTSARASDFGRNVGGAEVPLGRSGAVALVDAADLPLVARYRWTRVRGGSRADPRLRYAATIIREGGAKRQVFMHRLLLGAKVGQEVDHINHDGLDNRRVNIRLCSRAENLRNRRSPGSLSGYRGVQEGKPGRWNAVIMRDYRAVRIGSFGDPVAAAVAYDVAARGLHGEFALLNFSVARDWIIPASALVNREEIGRRCHRLDADRAQAGVREA